MADCDLLNKTQLYWAEPCAYCQLLKAKKICINSDTMAGNVRGGDLEPLGTTSSNH